VLEEGTKRQRKKVERIEVAAATTPTDKALTIKEGRGVRLGEIPYVEAQLNKSVGAELKPLHKLLFGRIGAVSAAKCIEHK
jgi:protein DEK